MPRQPTSIHAPYLQPGRNLPVQHRIEGPQRKRPVRRLEAHSLTTKVTSATYSTYTITELLNYQFKESKCSQIKKQVVHTFVTMHAGHNHFKLLTTLRLRGAEGQ
jgi:hypothetical protein